jgi:Predicted Peptidoglycan domain
MKLFLVISCLFFLCFQPPPPDFNPVIEHSKIEVVPANNCDSMKAQLFMAQYKLERVKYYLKICQRNPKQTKFLVSWINRAIK